jgi:hypothetical protein
MLGHADGIRSILRRYSWLVDFRAVTHSSQSGQYPSMDGHNWRVRSLLGKLSYENSQFLSITAHLSVVHKGEKGSLASAGGKK